MISKGYSWTGNRYIAVLVSIGFCLIAFGCTKADDKDVDEAVLFQKTFTEGVPDPKVEFPEEEFAKAKELRKEMKPDSAKKLLLSKLEAARKSSVGTTKLGKYLVRLNNVLFDQGDDPDALKYGEIALKIFYDQPLEKRPLAPWMVNIHSYLAMSYDRQGKFDEAIKHYQKALQVSHGAPKAEVSENWMKLLYNSLAEVYKKTDKKEAEMKVRKQMFTLYKIPIPKDEDEKEADKKNTDKKKKKSQKKRSKNK